VTAPVLGVIMGDIVAADGLSKTPPFPFLRFVIVYRYQTLEEVILWRTLPKSL